MLQSQIYKKINKLIAWCFFSYHSSTNVVFELVYDNNHSKPKGFKQLVLKTFVKKFVVNEKSYKKVV